jgi:head-tail adaptor
MTKLTVRPPDNEGETHKLDTEDHPEDPAVGKWYWHVTTSDDAPKKSRKDLWCITHLGSNYAEITHAFGGSTRVHLDNFAAECTYEPNAANIIQQRIEEQRQKVTALMGEVRDITQRLGVGARVLPEGETQALAIRGNHIDTYKTSLVKAKEKTLPELFEQIAKANKRMGKWMKATMIVLQAEAEGMQENIGLIENRIFNIELYAGLAETVTQVSDGEPAAMHEKIRLMQRRHYMDEECLANYTAGGMDFENIGAFHRWLAKPVNRDRVLPFPRCVVAFRVRRKDKEREPGFTIADLIRIYDARNADKSTYLYLRNGEQVYCLETKIDFEEELFPDLDQRQLSGKLWAKRFVDFEKLITDDQYQGMVEDNKKIKKENARIEAEREKKFKAAKTEEEKEKYHPFWSHGRRNLHDLSRYVAFTPETVYYDDILAFVKSQVDKHNRLVLVLQGLLDRSPVFHPHPPWSLWKPEGFDAALELKYDVTNALVAGEKPDFEAYRAACNAEITIGTVVTGQQDLWEKHEAEKECARIDANWREARHAYRPKRFKPDGNPGPGILARVVRISKAKYTVSFEWQRSRKRDYWRAEEGDTLSATFTVAADQVFNVEAYKPGDYKQFYADPRTREEYIKWAPLLLVAEDFHAGKRTVKSRGYLVKEHNE